MIIITLTIISFVVFFSPYSKLNPGAGETRLGSINGKEITIEQFDRARRDASLQFFFMSGGRWPEDAEARNTNFDLDRETYQWLLLLQKAKEMGIHISSDMVVDVARNMLVPFQRSGITTPQQFSTMILERRGLSIADFERFVRSYLTIQQLVATFGLPGKLVTPADARALYVRENQELATEAVFFNPSNYLAKVAVTPEAIGSYYTNRMAMYRLPERVEVKYVEFGLSNHLDIARSELMKTNLEELVSMNMQRLGTNYLRFGTNEAQVRDRIREDLIRSRALIEARKKAIEFATLVFETEPSRLENFQNFAQSNNLAVQVSKPFGMRETPEGLEVPPTFASAAFGLSNSTNEFFGGPIVGDNAVYVIAYHNRLPSEIPPFDQVRERVTEDFKMEQARGMANAAGAMFHRALTNGIAQGKAFAEVAKENNFEAVTLPPLSLGARSLPQIDGLISINELKQIAFSLQPGEVSPFQPTSEGGVILRLNSKLPVDTAKMEQELPNYLSMVRQNRQTEAFNEWFRKEANVGLRDTPIMAPRTPDNMTSGGQKS